MGPSGLRPILPGAYLIQTSCKQSFKSTVSFGGLPQFPAQIQVPSQKLPSPQLLSVVQSASASQQMTQSYAASSSWRQLYPKQPLPVPPVSGVKEVGPLPFQQSHPPQLGPVHRIPQRQPESSQLVQHTAATPYPAYHPLPPVDPVELDIHQLPAADSRRLTDEFPFSYSIAKELPHIFGNFEDDEVLDRPLTPSFELPIPREPWWDTMAAQSALYHSSPASLTKEDFIHNGSPNYKHVQPSNFNSCCFGSSQMLSPPPLSELSCGLISKGRSFSFYRQD